MIPHWVTVAAYWLSSALLVCEVLALIFVLWAWLFGKDDPRFEGDKLGYRS